MTIKQIIEKLEELEKNGKGNSQLHSELYCEMDRIIDAECEFYAQAYLDVVEDYEQNILTV